MAGEATQLRELMQVLFRRFGVLASDRTPCGQALPIAHAHALMVLLASQPLTQQQLGQALCIDKSNVTRLCQKLSSAGHIEQRVGDDARQRLVRLTPSGKRLARQVDEASEFRFRAIIDSMSSHRKQLIPVLQELVRGMEQLSPPTEPDS
ncbi:MAG: MarR family winged helix-turn-helix transcriptional regulator [Polyangiaceae bacterium]